MVQFSRYSQASLSSWVVSVSPVAILSLLSEPMEEMYS